MKTVFSILSLLLLLNISVVFESSASNRNPSSGRRLRYGHWLTCDSSSHSQYRQSSAYKGILRDTDQSRVDQDVPYFNGQVHFEVNDTWEEWVTKFGSSCPRCGETCSAPDKNGNRSCSCNTCSWQELETFYRPWSVQKLNYRVEWQPRSDYRQRRQQWFSQGQKPIAHDKSNIEQLMNFDPDRPNEYYLFPGETETVNVTLNGGRTIDPGVSISGARSQHSVKITHGAGTRECDDIDLNLKAAVSTGARLVTDPPNSIQFKSNWVEGKKTQGQLAEEPYKFRLVDVSTMFYENQNVMDHYKDTKVEVRLRQLDRWLWVDRFISKYVQVNDTTSIVGYQEDKSLPPVATFEILAQDLFKTYWREKVFHLIPGKSYEVCSRMTRYNNIYYRTKGWFGRQIWSGWTCSMFIYNESAPDLRSGGRAFKDAFTRWFPVPVWLIFF